MMRPRAPLRPMSPPRRSVSSSSTGSTPCTSTPSTVPTWRSLSVVSWNCRGWPPQACDESACLAPTIRAPAVVHPSLMTEYRRRPDRRLGALLSRPARKRADLRRALGRIGNSHARQLLHDIDSHRRFSSIAARSMPVTFPKPEVPAPALWTPYDLGNTNQAARSRLSPLWVVLGRRSRWCRSRAPIGVYGASGIVQPVVVLEVLS